MDSAADGLLALSNTVAAIAVDNSLPNDDDDRSSSLTELEDAEDEEEEIVQVNNAMDGDSEAETERLEESPDKSKRAFQLSPSKLAQSVNVADERPEIEELTNSEASSPITPIEESPLQSELSEAEDMPNPLDILSQAAAATNKRKRLSDVMDMTEDLRPRKRRTESVDSEDEKSDVESELPEVPSREPTVEADDPEVQAESEKDDGPEQEQTELSDGSKSKKPEQYTRSRSRRGKDPAEPEVQDEEDNEAVEASDEDVEADDVETTAKNEEEQLKRAAAMEALTALERHFATLRDKLYDEKIAQLNHELDQLTEVESTHPELLKQFECVNKYRDEKQDTEQKLLVFKVGALKRKSLAERSQIHSAYFQTVRDVRERHMERMSEHFYRIQRERFKSSQVTPTYTIPFPEKRIQQVTQQTAYNREVSILSGVAKYVGFPAAPELPSVQASDLEGDMQKMGVSSQHPPNPTHTDELTSTDQLFLHPLPYHPCPHLSPKPQHLPHNVSHSPYSCCFSRRRRRCRSKCKHNLRTTIPRTNSVGESESPCSSPRSAKRKPFSITRRHIFNVWNEHTREPTKTRRLHPSSNRLSKHDCRKSIRPTYFCLQHAA